MRKKLILSVLTASAVSITACASNTPTTTSEISSEALSSSTNIFEESSPAIDETVPSQESTSSESESSEESSTDTPEEIITENVFIEKTTIGDYIINKYSSYAEILFYVGNDKKVTIPSELDGVPVTRIYNAAFEGKEIECLTIPDSVIFIGNGILKDHTELTEVNLGNGITCIPAYAFSGCNSLTKISIPSTVSTIESYAFSSCGISDLTIPGNVTELSSYAFSSCAELSELKLEEGIKRIASSCFSGTGLTDVSLPTSLTYLDESAFNGTPFIDSHSEEFVVLGDGFLYSYNGAGDKIVIPDNVKHIMDRDMFANATEVVIGNNVDYVENASSLKKFYTEDEFGIVGNSILVSYNGTDTKVTVPDGIKQLSNAFAGKDFEEIILPDSLKYISNYAFKDTKINSIKLPDSLERIGADAFSNSSITEIEIPSGVTSLYENTFKRCYSLKNVIIDSTKSIGNNCFQECYSLESVSFGDSLEVIGEHAFSDCEQLKEVVLPDTVMQIDANAFSGCINLKSAMLSDNIEALNSAFINCYALETIHLPNELKSIDFSTFTNCLALHDLILPATIMTDELRSGIMLLAGFIGTIHVDANSDIAKYYLEGCSQYYTMLKDEDSAKNYVAGVYDMYRPVPGQSVLSHTSWTIGSIEILDNAGNVLSGPDDSPYSMLRKAFLENKSSYSGLWTPAFLSSDNGMISYDEYLSKSEDYYASWFSIGVPVYQYDKDGNIIRTLCRASFGLSEGVGDTEVVPGLMLSENEDGSITLKNNFLEFTCVFSDDYQSMTVTEKNEPGDVVIYKKF